MVILIIFLICLNINLKADYITSIYNEFYRPGVESTATGGEAIFSDSGFTTIFYNPSHLSFVNKKFGFYFSRENFSLMEDISHITVGLFSRVINKPLFYTAISWRRINYLPASGYNDNENIFMLSLSVKYKNFYYGINNKLLLSYIDYPTVNSTPSGTAFDTGFSFIISRFLAGFSILNFYSILKYEDNYKQHFPAVYKLFIEYHFNKIRILLGFEKRRIIKLGGGIKYKLKNFETYMGFNSSLMAGFGFGISIKNLKIKYGLSRKINENLMRSSFSLLFTI